MNQLDVIELGQQVEEEVEWLVKHQLEEGLAG
jgi:hypothetical protein